MALPAPYKILRQPTPASDEPYQLPEGTAIDLRASGVGVGDSSGNGYFYWPSWTDNSDGVIIMFAPEGRVSRVSFSQVPHDTTLYDNAVVEPVFLLVGRRENIPAPAVANGDPTIQSSITGVTIEDDRAALRKPLNWLGNGSRWVVLGAQSGKIATIENAYVDMAGLYTKFVTNGSLSPGTEELRTQQILAAREFTHEMSQLGGR